MEYRSSMFVGILFVFLKILSFSKGLETSTVLLKSSQVNSVHSVNCSNTAWGENYRCVKIEDCKIKQRARGDKRFCKWDVRPTHVCCLHNSDDRLEKSHTVRRKRYDSDFDDDYRPSRRFHHHNREWGYDDNSWEMPSCDHHHGYHRKRSGYPEGYDKDSETFDNANWRNSFDEPECGVLESEERSHILAAAVGGSPVETAASTPWMVAVGQTQENEETRWFCGGVLISRRIVITAAHCITRRKANLVRVGDLDLSSDRDLADPQESEIESSVLHPSHLQPKHYHDIAIIRLRTPVRYTKYVRPICLPPDDGNLYENARVTLTGWGNTQFGGESSPILQRVNINVISNSQCNKSYGDPETVRSNARTLPRGIINSQMCAGDENGGRDACQGDSGGPIILKEGRRRIVVGLVSSGRGCGSKFYPGIYTRVSSYTDWIRSFL